MVTKNNDVLLYNVKTEQKEEKKEEKKSEEKKTEESTIPTRLTNGSTYRIVKVIISI